MYVCTLIACYDGLLQDDDDKHNNNADFCLNAVNDVANNNYPYTVDHLF
jgi:hypothetical protein